MSDEQEQALAAAVIATNKTLREAEQESKRAKTEAMEHVAATLSATFKALKPLADLSENSAYNRSNIQNTLFRFWDNAR